MVYVKSRESRNGSTNIDLAFAVTSTVTTVVAAPLYKLYPALEYHYSREEEWGENMYLHACDSKTTLSRGRFLLPSAVMCL